jgi:hypothetical protein
MQPLLSFLLIQPLIESLNLFSHLDQFFHVVLFLQPV